MNFTEKKNPKEVKPTSTIKKVRIHSVSKQSIQLKAEEPEVHYLKVQPFFRHSRSRLLHKPAPKVVPELRLCGKWLEDAGFDYETYVSVTVINGLLIIRSVEKQEIEPEGVCS